MMSGMASNKRVLVSTISPENGGISANLRFITKTLQARGFEPVLAHYEPYSVSPHLSVPSFRLVQRGVKNELRHALDGYETHAIGAWLPEFEFTHYLATTAWRRVMDSCCAFLAVAGNALAGLPYLQTGRPCVSWIASGWHMDRKDRVEQFSSARKIVDRAVVRPVVRWLERSLLRSGSVLALSEYTRGLLNTIAGAPVVRNVLPPPIDTAFFSPIPNKVIRGNIGFSGRLTDPRKNVQLLLQALHVLRRAGHEVRVVLIGGEPDNRLQQRLEELKIRDAVEFSGHVPLETLRDKLQTLDVFAVPSHQEGLCIAALEAMACGCPVVSTRCGGPEEFVVDDETGFLIDADPIDMADAIIRLLRSPKLRQRLGTTARDKVKQDYSLPKASAIFWRAFDEQYG
jgi:glycosyltransferase involved in cell wall biosynthesis